MTDDQRTPREPEEPRATGPGQRDLAGADFANAERPQNDERDPGLPDRRDVTPETRRANSAPSGDEVSGRRREGSERDRPRTEP